MGNLAKLPGYKDEDGDSSDRKTSVIIETADNGWIVEFSNDEEDGKAVFTDKQKLMKKLEEIL